MARVLIVEARFYAHLNDLLLEGAQRRLAGHEVEVVTVPGALEVPARSRWRRRAAAMTPSSRSAS